MGSIRIMVGSRISVTKACSVAASGVTGAIGYCIMHRSVIDDSNDSCNRLDNKTAGVPSPALDCRKSFVSLRKERVGFFSSYLVLNVVYLAWAAMNILKGGNTIYVHQARAFLLWPLRWPADLGGWFRGRDHSLWAAIVGWSIFLCLVVKIATADTRRSFWKAVVLLGVLFLVSLGGCCNRSLNSFNDAF